MALCMEILELSSGWIHGGNTVPGMASCIGSPCLNSDWNNGDNSVPGKALFKGIPRFSFGWIHGDNSLPDTVRPFYGHPAFQFPWTYGDNSVPRKASCMGTLRLRSGWNRYDNSIPGKALCMGMPRLSSGWNRGDTSVPGTVLSMGMPRFSSGWNRGDTSVPGTALCNVHGSAASQLWQNSWRHLCSLYVPGTDSCMGMPRLSSGRIRGDTSVCTWDGLIHGNDSSQLWQNSWRHLCTWDGFVHGNAASQLFSRQDPALPLHLLGHHDLHEGGVGTMHHSHHLPCSTRAEVFVKSSRCLFNILSANLKLWTARWGHSAA